MNTVMDMARTKYNKGKVNIKFEAFAKDFGFEIKPCKAYFKLFSANFLFKNQFGDNIVGYN